MKMRIAALTVLAGALAWMGLVGQTVNQGRTYTGTLNVRYANEGATGTTVNKLAKLTGAPSTAIIVATTDTSGIVGVVIAGAGTTGNAVIAFKGKASCVFDSATTAGHYVINDTSTAGDCMDSGASTYPTTGQVIGVVTSTNGGAGTYEVDLTLGQPQAGGTGGGTGTYDVYANLPGTCSAGDQYWTSDAPYQILCSPANTWNHFFSSFPVSRPNPGWAFLTTQGSATASVTTGPLVMTAPTNATATIRAYGGATPGGAFTITIGMLLSRGNTGGTGGIVLRNSGGNSLVIFGPSYGSINMGVFRYTNETTFSATAIDIGSGGSIMFPGSGAWWLRIQDDGVTNRTYYTSADNRNWVLVFTEGRTTFLTADQAGVFLFDNATFNMAGTFFHLTFTTP